MILDDSGNLTHTKCPNLLKVLLDEDGLPLDMILDDGSNLTDNKYPCPHKLNKMFKRGEFMPLCRTVKFNTPKTV